MQNFDLWKPVRIWAGKIHGFIRVYDGTRYLELFQIGKYNVNFNRIWYLIGLKSGITYVISHNYTKIKVNSYHSLPS